MSPAVYASTYNNRCELVAETLPGNIGITYGYDLNGNRTFWNKAGAIDYYGIDPLMNRLSWVNRGVNSAPSAGQNSAYTLFGYDLNGRMTTRDRRDDNGTRKVYSFLWDGDDRLRQVTESGASKFTASYDGDGLRVSKWDVWSAVTHNYSFGPSGLVQDDGVPITFTPGLAQHTASADRFYRTDWLGSTPYLTDASGNGYSARLRSRVTSPLITAASGRGARRAGRLSDDRLGQ